MVRQSYLHGADFATYHLQLQRRQADKIFNVHLKPNGMGMGFRISRTIVEYMAGACEPPTTDNLRAAQVCISPYPAKASPPE
jgi:hypothetical protein